MRFEMQVQSMTRTLLAVLTIAAAALLPAAHAVEIEGVKIDDKIVLSSGGAGLVLNGAGVRHKFAFLKIYIGSLYLPQKTRDREAILADPGPKRVSMHILSDEVTARDLISSMNNALAANLVPHELALIEKRIRDLNRMMSSIKAINKGSVVNLDYIPEAGTRITVNGETKLTIPGEDFYRAMLHIWIGSKPVDGRLRDAMLGG
jgi:hypothetical protein